jgi:hypothetical protein
LAVGDPRRFTNSSQAFIFATGPTTQINVDRSIPGNPNGSLFLRKPAGSCTAGNPCSNAIANPNGHSGGTNWPVGSAGFNAASAWINGGLGPMPIELAQLIGLTNRAPSSPASRTGITAGRLLADLFRRPQ